MTHKRFIKVIVKTKRAILFKPAKLILLSYANINRCQADKDYRSLNEVPLEAISGNFASKIYFREFKMKALSWYFWRCWRRSGWGCPLSNNHFKLQWKLKFASNNYCVLTENHCCICIVVLARRESFLLLHINEMAKIFQ